MSQIEKLIEKMRRRPSEMDHRDVVKVLAHFGWHFDRQRGSHESYVKPGGDRPIVLKQVRGRVYDFYLSQIRVHLGLDQE